mgnify:CR=1 FL=1
MDVFGHPAEWDEILRIAEKYNLKVIDDSCEAIGAEYRGKKLGQFGEGACFAFYPNKQSPQKRVELLLLIILI